MMLTFKCWEQMWYYDLFLLSAHCGRNLWSLNIEIFSQVNWLKNSAAKPEVWGTASVKRVQPSIFPSGTLEVLLKRSHFKWLPFWFYISWNFSLWPRPHINIFYFNIPVMKEPGTKQTNQVLLSSHQLRLFSLKFFSKYFSFSYQK